MNSLVTGGCGFVGSNLAARLLKQGDPVTVFDNLGRHGAEANLEWLRGLGPVTFIQGDVRHAHELDGAIGDCRPEAVFHLAGQVAMTASMNDPRADFEINVIGSLNVLESVRRRCPEAVIVYSSSNKVYGELAGIGLVEEARRYSAPALPEGIDESAPLDFQTPYGCSKGAADQYMLDYARSYGLKTVVFRHSTIYGGRQHATFDQGWVGWFCQQALAVKKNPGREPFTIFGDGKQVRDLLFVDDAVDCYLRAAGRGTQAKGQAFNLGGGMANSSSLLELFGLIEELLEVKLAYRRLPWRHSDQKFFVANNAKAGRLLGWEPRVTKEQGVALMLEWTERLL